MNHRCRHTPHALHNPSCMTTSTCWHQVVQFAPPARAAGVHRPLVKRGLCALWRQGKACSNVQACTGVPVLHARAWRCCIGRPGPLFLGSCGASHVRWCARALLLWLLLLPNGSHHASMLDIHTPEARCSLAALAEHTPRVPRFSLRFRVLDWAAFGGRFCVCESGPLMPLGTQACNDGVPARSPGSDGGLAAWASPTRSGLFDQAACINFEC
jgi:hypothetical protein